MDAKRKLEEDVAWKMWDAKKNADLKESYFLDADKLDKGLVLVQPLYESGGKSVSMLTLSLEPK